VAERPDGTRRDQRIARVETQQEQLRTDLDRLVRSVETLSEGIHTFMQHSGRLPTGPIIGAAGVLLTVLTLAASPFIRDIQRHELAMLATREKIVQIQMNRWTSEDARRDREALAERLRFLETEQARRSSAIQAIEAEQARRKGE